jgi:hypothetical protein
MNFSILALAFIIGCLFLFPLLSVLTWWCYGVVAFILLGGADYFSEGKPGSK